MDTFWDCMKKSHLKKNLLWLLLGQILDKIGQLIIPTSGRTESNLWGPFSLILFCYFHNKSGINKMLKKPLGVDANLGRKLQNTPVSRYFKKIRPLFYLRLFYMTQIKYKLMVHLGLKPWAAGWKA